MTGSASARRPAEPTASARRVLCCSVSAAGAALAGRLPFPHRAGRLVETVRDAWPTLDGLVIVGATGLAVRAVAPLLGAKGDDPGVVVVDDGGRFAVALCGGHAGGANRLAREVAGWLGAQPVVTTASDGAGVVALDDLPGFEATGDLAGVMRRWLDGARPALVLEPGLEEWPVPPALADALAAAPSAAVATDARPRVTVTDAARPARPGEVVLRPPSLVVGVGASTGADPASLRGLIAATLGDLGLDPGAVGAVATIDARAADPAVAAAAAALGAAVRSFGAPDLAEAAARRRVPSPSPVVDAAVGTPSVCEAAALLAAGPGSTLLAPKRVAPARDCTVAVARRRRPAGHLAVVGLGPGRPGARTPEATAAVAGADVVVGYGPYVDLVADVLTARQRVLRFPIGEETERCRTALAEAAAGHRAALVCSGDPGVYAMASLVCELAPALGGPPVTVVPGVTAALSGAALLGAPLGHDHASISLSDLLTPWPVIRRRLHSAGRGDFVVSLYNPRSAGRPTQLAEAVQVLAAYRPATTPAAVLTDIGRPGEQVTRATLATLDVGAVGMLSLVVVGASTTRWIGVHMVTPRGYGDAP